MAKSKNTPRNCADCKFRPKFFPTRCKKTGELVTENDWCAMGRKKAAK